MATSEGKIRLTVNGKTVSVEEGSTLLDGIRAAGFDVPTLCHDPRLAPASSCRLCEVAVEGCDRPVCSCATPARDGIRLQTHTPDLELFRKTILTALAARHPAEAPREFPGKLFHQLLLQYGVEAGWDASGAASIAKDTAHPYIQVAMDLCVHCYRCVSICENLQGQNVWKVEGRGAETRVVPDSGTTLLASTCVSCGACVDTCPSGALEDASIVRHGVPDHWVRTTCPYCGTGCEMEVGIKDDRLITSRPVYDAPVSKGHLCVKGRYATGFVDAPDRVTSPMIRRDGAWEKVSWDEALDAAAEALKRALRDHGPSAVGVLGSSRSTNEESYLAAKFGRVVIGTNNVDCCARVCHAPSAAGLGLVFGTGAATNCFDDIERTQAMLVVGANPTENHPIVGARIRQRARKGVPLIVIDPRRTELADCATIHLALRPGTNVPLLNAIARVIVDEGLCDSVFIAGRTEGFAEYARSLEPWTPERAAEICGVNADLIREAARLYAISLPAMCFNGLGMTEQVQGTDGIVALANLAMLTGNIGVPGGGVNPLRGQNNVQGTANMGCEPARLTGYQKIESAKALHEKVWGVPVPSAPGLNLMLMLDAARADKLKSLLMIGYDVYLSNPHAAATAAALGKLDSLIVVDLFMTESAREFGTVFLPVVSSYEKDGTFMNGERRIQRLRRALTPRGEAKADWEVMCLLARRMGFARHFAFEDVESVWNEVRAVWPSGQGISYARLDAEAGIQWPCLSEDAPGTEVLHAKSFPIGPKASFRPLAYRPSAQHATSEFPLILNTGRALFHFNAATMTGRSRNLELRPDDLVEIHPADAARLGVRNLARIEVESAYGKFVGRANVTDIVREGELFATFHNIAAFVNRATGPGRDSVTHTPEYKVTAVRVRALKP